MGVVRLPFILDAFFGGLLFSVFCLSWAWRMAPICGSPLGSIPKIIICLFGIALEVFLWISLFLPLLKGTSICQAGIARFLLYLSLVGATPIAGFPAILIYGPGKKSRKPK